MLFYTGESRLGGSDGMLGLAGVMGLLSEGFAGAFLGLGSVS